MGPLAACARLPGPGRREHLPEPAGHMSPVTPPSPAIGRTLARGAWADIVEDADADDPASVLDRTDEATGQDWLLEEAEGLEAMEAAPCTPADHHWSTHRHGPGGTAE
eukprot:13586543-Alexandrium_andersonii.AAC.1